MNILLVGYGKMGKAVEQKALQRGHVIVGAISQGKLDEYLQTAATRPDAAIEFTQPDAAVENISKLISAGIPTVTGTTGWLEALPAIEQLVKDNNGSFFHATNFSVGVNLFNHINRLVAEVMNNYPDYSLGINEIHHTEKKDAPSGTAITLAKAILEKYTQKGGWHAVTEENYNGADLPVTSQRLPDVPGTHTVYYTSLHDTIEITHTAKNREGFATGAVMAAEFLADKKGVFGMKELLGV